MSLHGVSLEICQSLPNFISAFFASKILKLDQPLDFDSALFLFVLLFIKSWLRLECLPNRAKDPQCLIHAGISIIDAWVAVFS